MKNITLGLLLGLIFILIATAGLAQQQAPEGVDVYYPAEGWFCVRDVELGFHYCSLIDPCCDQEECFVQE